MEDEDANAEGSKLGCSTRTKKGMLWIMGLSYLLTASCKQLPLDAYAPKLKDEHLASLENQWKSGDAETAYTLAIEYDARGIDEKALLWSRRAGEIEACFLHVDLWRKYIQMSEGQSPELQQIVFGGVAKSPDEAVALILEKASRKFVDASSALGDHYYRKLFNYDERAKFKTWDDWRQYASSHSDLASAIRWFEDAARRGDVHSKKVLPELYEIRGETSKVNSLGLTEPEKSSEKGENKPTEEGSPSSGGTLPKP